jgi:hypothetical protein
MSPMFFVPKPQWRRTVFCGVAVVCAKADRVEEPSARPEVWRKERRVGMVDM